MILELEFVYLPHLKYLEIDDKSDSFRQTLFEWRKSISSEWHAKRKRRRITDISTIYQEGSKLLSSPKFPAERINIKICSGIC